MGNEEGEREGKCTLQHSCKMLLSLRHSRMLYFVFIDYVTMCVLYKAQEWIFSVNFSFVINSDGQWLFLVQCTKCLALPTMAYSSYKNQMVIVW